MAVAVFNTPEVQGYVLFRTDMHESYCLLY